MLKLMSKNSERSLDFQPLAKNSKWLFFSLAKDADQLAFSLKMLELFF